MITGSGMSMKPSTQESTKGVRGMKSEPNKQNQETEWYENYELVKEYLAAQLTQKSAGKEKNSQAVNFCWLEILGKPQRS